MVHATRLSRAGMAGFAIGSLGAGVCATVPTVLLLYFCTEVLRISPAVAALIVFIPKAGALLWDPAIGAWSDRCRSAWGRRAPFVFAGALGITAGLPLVFGAPSLDEARLALYMGAAYFALALSSSLFTVPYSAVPAEICHTAAEREQLMTWRMVCAMSGVLLGAGVAPNLVQLAGGGRSGYAVMSWLVAATCGIAMLTSCFVVRSHRSATAPERAHASSVFDDVRRVTRHRGYARLWLSYACATAGVALFLALSPYFVTRVLHGSEGDAGTALIALLAGTVCAIPLWGHALQRFDGWKLLAAAAAAFIVTVVLFRWVPSGTKFAACLPLYFAVGIPFAGLQLLPFTLLAHLAHAAAATGQRSEGLYTGIWTAGEKLALAIGPALAGVALSAIGYVAGQGEQSASTLATLQTLVAIGPALLALPCLLLVLRSPVAVAVARPVA